MNDVSRGQEDSNPFIDRQLKHPGLKIFFRKRICPVVPEHIVGAQEFNVRSPEFSAGPRVLKGKPELVGIHRHLKGIRSVALCG